MPPDIFAVQIEIMNMLAAVNQVEIGMALWDEAEFTSAHLNRSEWTPVG
jgi:hypothetical protein